jgi:hypothetical protein
MAKFYPSRLPYHSQPRVDQIGKRRVRLDHRFGVGFGKPGPHLAVRLDASAADQPRALRSLE